MKFPQDVLRARLRAFRRNLRFGQENALSSGMDTKFDIFKRLPDGHPIWVKAVEGLAETKAQVGSLVVSAPGDYFIYNYRYGFMEAEKTKNAVK